MNGVLLANSNAIMPTVYWFWIIINSIDVILSSSTDLKLTDLIYSSFNFS